MPELIVQYNPEVWDTDTLRSLGRGVRPLVAAATSTDSVKLEVKHVDWLPTADDPAALVDADLAIKLVTIGFPERKLKFDKVAQKRLADEIRGLPELQGWDPSRPILWVHFTDPDGAHV